MKKHDKPLTKKQLEKLGKNSLGWKLNKMQTKVSKTFAFDKHIDGLIFIARLTVHAQLLQHHPHITFTYQAVKIDLQTHDVKALTGKDLSLLSRIEKVHAKLYVDNDED